MKIRYAKSSDVDFLVEGLKDTRLISGWAEERASKPTDRPEFEKSVEKRYVRVAEIDGEPAAFIHFKDDFKVMYIDGAFFWIDLIYVKNQHRGEGLGKALYADIEQIAKERGVERIVLDIFGVNKESIDFHKKVGFEPLYTIYQKKV